MASLTLIIVFILCLALGFPIGLAMGVAGLGAMIIVGSAVPPDVIASSMVNSMNHFVFIVVPMFALVGTLMQESRMAERLVDVVAILLRQFRGALAQVAIWAEMFFHGISGSFVADIAVIASTMLRPMERAGYTRAYAAAVVAVPAAAGMLVPPSTVLIVIGTILNVSVIGLFIAGIVPAIVMALTVTALIGYDAHVQKFPTMQRVTLREMRSVLMRGLLPLGLPAIIFYGIFTGVGTITEISVVAVLYMSVVGLVTRSLDARKIWRSMKQAGRITGVLAYLVGLSALFQYVFVLDRVPERMATIAPTAFGPAVFLLFMSLFFIVLGSVLEPIPAALILIPIFYPIATTLGVGVMQFGVVVVAALGMGTILPPAGIGTLVSAGIGEVSPARVFPHIWRFLGAYAVGVVLLIVFPQLSTALLSVFKPR